MSPVINTKYGPVRGLQKSSCYQIPYCAYYGIPYAKQPLGSDRFKDPHPLDPWNGIFDATKPGDACWNHDRINPIEKKIIGSDKCLHLNIYVPLLKSGKSLPVMVYIHGGRFNTMSNSPFYYGPDYLIEKQVILVTINYRIGAFGFLSLKDSSLETPGNAGLKDQVMALKFVKENIQYFGGDPDNITLFGQSAGGASVHYHLLSEQSKGLFHKAIIMSGSALGSWAVIEDRQYAYRLANALGYEGPKEDEASILDFLNLIDGQEIVKIQDTILSEEERRVGQLVAFSPLIEPYLNSNTFIPSHPFDMVQNAWGKSMDIIIGGCSMEGLFIYSTITPELLESLGDFSNFVARNANLNPDSEESKHRGLKLKNLYYKDEKPSMNNTDSYVYLQGDKLFWYGMWKTIKSRQPSSKTWIYRLDVEPKSNKTLREIYKIPHQRGTCHVEDIFYLFKAQYLEAPEKGTEEYKIVEIMVRYFIQL